MAADDEPEDDEQDDEDGDDDEALPVIHVDADPWNANWLRVLAWKRRQEQGESTEEEDEAFERMLANPDGQG